VIVAFFGDTHGNIELMFEKAAEWEQRTKLDLDFLVQVGDFGVWPNPESVDEMSRKHAEKEGLSPIGDFRDYVLGNYVAPRPLYFIRGNHEDQRFLRHHQKIQMALYSLDYRSRTIQLCPNIYYVPDGHVVDIQGVRFAAWGGNFSSKTWNSKVGYWDLPDGRKLNHMTQDIYEHLLTEKFDVLLTHDAPIGSGVVGAMNIKLPKDEMSGAGCEPVLKLIDLNQPRYQFNGHWHQFRKNQFGRTTAYVLDKVAPHEPDALCMEVLEL
jgi:Icc-related predicted phosphoesterase